LDGGDVVEAEMPTPLDEDEEDDDDARWWW
jgi:hypothetical protein